MVKAVTLTFCSIQQHSPFTSQKETPKKSTQIRVKVNNGNTQTICKICTNLTLKPQKQHQWRSSSVFLNAFDVVSMSWWLWAHFTHSHGASTHALVYLASDVHLDGLTLRYFTDSYLLKKQNAENECKIAIQSLERDFVWYNTRIHSRTFIFQHIPVWFIFNNERN